MPIYEYVPDDRECLMCDGRIEVLQSADEEPLAFCPGCGLEVLRVVSRPSICHTRAEPNRAAERGFTTWRKSGTGTWEKVAGPGVDYLVGTSEQIQQVHEDAKPKRVYDIEP